MKFISISDTHSKHNQIPLEWLEPADCIIHAGDISSMGYDIEIYNFCSWFSKLDQYKHKIFIAGNHDWGFERNPNDVALIIKEFPNITYLQDSSVEIEGIKIYGSPWQPEFFNWAFNLERGAEIQNKWDMIPTDTDILITHGPAYGHGDFVPGPRGGYVGCQNLLDTILTKVNPKVHIAGHNHCGYGESFKGNTHVINAATLNEQYIVTNPPIKFEL
jgi:Icc-related predicted phosphoesterase